MKRAYFTIGLVGLMMMGTGCEHIRTAPERGYETYNYDRLPYQNVRYNSGRSSEISDFDKIAYELGKDPQSLSAQDRREIEERRQLRELEKTLSSPKEREQYSKILPWLQTDREKIALLKIPSLEGRQAWINKNNIWSRSRFPATEMKQLVDSQDIAVGMPQEYVRRSWGDPLLVEFSGSPIYKNERWKYQRQVSSVQGYRKETRYVYFEGGRVVGWETE